jgi:hypothetical protein
VGDTDRLGLCRWSGIGCTRATKLAPWTADDGEANYVVRTANGFVLSITYFDDEPNRDFNLRKDEARRIALAITRLPDLLEKSEEGIDGRRGSGSEGCPSRRRHRQRPR